MVKKSVAVIGRGFVGGALTQVFCERGAEVVSFDISKNKLPFGIMFQSAEISDLVKELEQTTSFSNIYFVCVPTPMNKDGSCDTSIVEKVLRNLAIDWMPDRLLVTGQNSRSSRIAVIKSTVPPGSTEKWNKMFNESGLYIIHNPEFLRETTAIDDMRNQDRIVLGGPRPWINTIKQFYENLFPNVPIIKTSSTNTELIKYITNCFLATKISFANEMYQLVSKLSENGLDVDYDRIIEIAALDKRLGSSHWKVPSFERDDDGNPLFGYSGSCFPKDINSIISVGDSIGVDMKVLKASWQKNLEVRPQKDWEKLVGRAVSKKST